MSKDTIETGSRRRVVGFMVCGPNEKYLENSLKEFDRLCDDAVIVLNNATEKEKALVKEHGFWWYEDDREWGINQPSIKTDLLKRVAGLNPDWILAIDADEVFPPEFTREVMEEMMNGEEIAYHFLVVNLYNDKDHFVHSAGIQRFWNVRFYRYMPSLGVEFMNKAVHCGLAPPYAYKFGWHAPYYLEHYGLMAKEDRLRRVERYKKYDPNSKHKASIYYEELAKDLKPKEFNRKELLEKLKALPECQKRIIPKSLYEVHHIKKG